MRLEQSEGAVDRRSGHAMYACPNFKLIYN